MNRRSFIWSAGGVAIAGIAGSGRSLHAAETAAARTLFADPGPVRVAVLFDPGFPGADDFALTREDLAKALSEFTAEFLTAAELTAKLPDGGYALLVNPYGSAFPVDCWSTIRLFLSRGGSLLNLGGTPFAVPVRREGLTWRQEILQTSYHKSSASPAFASLSARIRKSATFPPTQARRGSPARSDLLASTNSITGLPRHAIIHRKMGVRASVTPPSGRWRGRTPPRET